MAPTIQYTDPYTHPRFIREQRKITAILASILIASGRSEPEALREAETVLKPKVLQRNIRASC